VTIVHAVVGFTLTALFTVGWVWGGWAWLRKGNPGPRFWTWLSTTQVVAIVQALLGMTLLATGHDLETWLHLVYGFGPLVILGVGHALARDENFRERPWLPFALASFICFGLALRAIATGLAG
jgi:hypothetical protein